MTELQTHNQNEKQEAVEATNEAPHKKTLRQQQQKAMVQTMAGQTFDGEMLKGMLEHAKNCSAEEFSKMLTGDPSKDIPPLSEMIMKEKLWNMTVDEQEKKHPGFKERLEKKITAESRYSIPTDRRILMAETAWEMEYTHMEKIIPIHLKNDLKKYYEKYDRSRAKSKHGIAAYDNAIPNCDEVVGRMRNGVMKRIVLEYTMLANEHFPKDTVKLWTDYIKDTKTPEDAIRKYKELTGEGAKKEGYIQIEEKFNIQRSDLMKKNPAAYDFFLRLYNKQTQEKLYETRNEVMDQAITHIEQAMAELRGVTTDKALLDLTKYENIEAILTQIKRLKEAQETSNTETPTSQLETKSTADILKEKRTAEEKLFSEDRDLRNLTIHEIALENAARAAEISERQSDTVVADKQARQMRKIKERRLQDQVTAALDNTSEKEEEAVKFTDGDIASNLTLIGTDANNGLEIKDSDQIADLAQVNKDLEVKTSTEGVNILMGVDQRGKKASAKNMKDAAENVQKKIEARKQSLLEKKVKEGTLDAKILDFSQARETKQERAKRRKTVLNNIDKIRRAA